MTHFLPLNTMVNNAPFLFIIALAIIILALQTHYFPFYVNLLSLISTLKVLLSALFLIGRLESKCN